MQHPVRCCGQGGTVCEIFINLIADIVNTRGQGIVPLFAYENVVHG
jgi:hypothetical protein